VNVHMQAQKTVKRARLLIAAMLCGIAISVTGAVPRAHAAVEMSPEIIVLFPHTREQVLEIGKAYRISWSRNGPFPKSARQVVNVVKNGVVQGPTIYTSSGLNDVTRSFLWIVPRLFPPGHNYTIRVWSYDIETGKFIASGESVLFSLWNGPSIAPVSSSSLAYALPLDEARNADETAITAVTVSSARSQFQIASPRVGEKISVGQTYKIIYSPRSTTRIRLALYGNGAFRQYIALDVLAVSGSYEWRVPSYLNPGSGYTIRIFERETPKRFSSSGHFTLQSKVLQKNLDVRYLPKL